MVYLDIKVFHLSAKGWSFWKKALGQFIINYYGKFRMSECLYRFYSYTENDLHSLANCYLWFSKLEDYNDPFEGIFSKEIYSFNIEELTASELTNSAKGILSGGKYTRLQVEKMILEASLNGEFNSLREEVYRSFISSLDTLFFEDFRESFCYCFCRSSKGSPVEKNKQMWSHYADGLRGFLVEFEQNQLIHSIEKLNELKVYYQTMEYEKLNKSLAKEYFLAFSKDQISHEHLTSMVCRKDEFWKYENELRFLTVASENPNKNLKNQHLFSFNSVRRVIIGDKMSSTKRNTLLAILKSMGVDIASQVYVAKVNQLEMELEIFPFDIE